MSPGYFSDNLCHVAILATFYVTLPFWWQFMSPGHLGNYLCHLATLTTFHVTLQLLAAFYVAFVALATTFYVNGQFTSLFKKWTIILPEFQQQEEEEQQQQQPQVFHKLQLHYVAAAKKGQFMNIF